MTTWEDIYPRERWADFLLTQGYAPDGPATFAKIPLDGLKFVRCTAFLWHSTLHVFRRTSIKADFRVRVYEKNAYVSSTTL